MDILKHEFAMIVSKRLVDLTSSDEINWQNCQGQKIYEAYLETKTSVKLKITIEEIYWNGGDPPTYKVIFFDQMGGMLVRVHLADTTLWNFIKQEGEEKNESREKQLLEKVQKRLDLA